MMRIRVYVIVLLCYVHTVSCRDYYVGMFKKNDLLVASDTLYRERVPHRLTYTNYGRIFKCDITYFRVADRLGMGRVPGVKIVRGGLRKKYVVLRITSGYDLPLSVNIYVGCENNYNFTRSTYIVRKTTTGKGTAKKKTTSETTDGTKDESVGGTGNGTTSLPSDSAGTSGPSDLGTTVEPSGGDTTVAADAADVTKEPENPDAASDAPKSDDANPPDATPDTPPE